ncbi:bifunctional GNAT family N-acetyltransferase/carbon-nitrogen hydrolase family protein [Bacillus suaedae]|uniref:Bifunctional GNAT family N-acetyltransferase/carbon-nitrogen hydrolase family protein n=1 Tax=Halalkalibacter suaedae TaxID=2822140 RepID=A0A940WVZ7_9BACI|nr:bifunctional GNAT family N-acetyltransferase/carbon-nitrogen hydrolase family protein [Bacillus suaedae]MBP3951487.1 bifunctional GNAT family N-acetyltransferase/carbon-nitrogen hydrolase family protein [Bacillus suaedae]
MSKKIDVSKFEKKMTIRNIEATDFDEIIEMQKLCFPNMEPWEIDHLQSHIDIFPEGQFCVEYDGKIIGSCSSLIINFDEYDDQHTWDEITDNGYITNHDPEGYNLYGIEVMVHPEYRRMKIGRRLYEVRKDLVRELNLKSIIIGGRIPNYFKFAKEMTPRQYVEEVTIHNIYDPVLTFQVMNGFTLKRINQNYLEDDRASLRYATLMEWNNIDYRTTSPKRQFKTSFPVRITTIQYEMKKISSFDDFAVQCEYYTDVAASYNSDFAVFPEIFTLQLLSFLPEKSPSLAIRRLTEFTEDYLDLFTHLAVKYNVNIVGGSHFVEEEGKIYNIAYLFRRDGTIEKQYKLHITPNERKFWGITGGNNVNVFDTDCGKVAIQICYDIEFPELARIAVDKGANIIFTPFCTDDRQGYLRVRYCSQARAIENQVYTVLSGTVGNLTDVENMDIQYAQSGIFSPSDFTFPRDGIVGEGQANIETVVVGDVDLEILRRNRRAGSVNQLRDRRHDIYQIHYKNK